MCTCHVNGRYFLCCGAFAYEKAATELRDILAEDDLGDYESEPTANDALLTVVFKDGRTVSVEIMVPTTGEAVVMRDGILLAEDRSDRLYSFPGVSHWFTDSI